MTDLLFDDRRQAGRLLATEVRLKGLSNPVVFAVARGGMPVACEIAKAISAPLDIFGVHRMSSPGNPTAFFGAIASDGSHAFDTEHYPDLGGLDGDSLTRMISAAQSTAADQERLYRRGRPLPDLKGRNVILVGDGMAAGIMMRVAVKAARRKGAAHVTVAVPATSDYAAQLLRAIADDVICLDNPEAFLGISCFYRKFEPIPDNEVCRLLDEFGKARLGDQGPRLH